MEAAREPGHCGSTPSWPSGRGLPGSACTMGSSWGCLVALQGPKCLARHWGEDCPAQPAPWGAALQGPKCLLGWDVVSL